MIATKPSQIAPRRFTSPGTTFQAVLFEAPPSLPDSEKRRAEARKQLERIQEGKLPVSRRKGFAVGVTLRGTTLAIAQREAYIENVGHEPRTIEKWGELL